MERIVEPVDTPDAQPTPLSQDVFLALGVAALTFLLGWLTWRPIPVGVWHDDGAYLLIAQALADERGLVWDGVPGELPAAKFPPLFSWFASLFLRGGMEAERAARPLAMISIGLMSAGFGLFAVTARRLLAWPAWAVGLLSLVVATTVGLWRLAAVPHSEPLFMVATAAAVLALTWNRPADPETEPRPGSAAFALFVLGFAAAFYSRTAAIALLGGAVLAIVVSGRWRPAILVGAAGVATALPWMVWSGAATERIPGPLRDVLGSYGSWWSTELARSPSALVGLVLRGGAGVARDLTDVLVPVLGPLEPGRGVGAFVLVAATTVGLIRLVARARGAGTSTGARAVAFYVLIYLGIIAVWPFRAQRLILPVVPWVVLGWAALLPGAKQRESTSSPSSLGGRLGTATAAALALWAILFVGSNGRALINGSHLASYQDRAAALAAAVDAVTRFTPAGAVVGAPELWPGLAIHTGRSVAPSARFLPLATDQPSWGSPTSQVELWHVAGIDHVVVEHGGGVHGATLDQMDAVCAEGAVELLATIPTGFLVRVNPTEACVERVRAASP